MASRTPLAEIFHTIRHISRHFAIAKQLQNPVTSRALAATAALASTVGSAIAYANMNRHQRVLETRLSKLRTEIANKTLNQDSDVAKIHLQDRKMHTAYAVGTFFIGLTGFFAFYMLGRWRGSRIAVQRYQIMQNHREMTWIRRDANVRRSLERLGRVKKEDETP